MWCDRRERVGQRQYIKSAKSASDGRLAIGGRIPRKPDPRFEIAKRWVQKIRRSQMRSRVGQVKKVRKPAVSLGRDRGRLVAEAGIDGQVFPDTYIVLNIRAKECLSYTKRRYGSGKQSEEISRLVDQQIRQ